MTSQPPVDPRTGPQPQSTPSEIRANSVLPAHREDIELHTADGMVLVGELATPLDLSLIHI